MTTERSAKILKDREKRLKGLILDMVKVQSRVEELAVRQGIRWGGLLSDIIEIKKRLRKLENIIK